jgi:hypothetical protein
MGLTTSQAIDLFLASLRTRSAPANTIKAYRLDLRQFLKRAPTDLSEVTANVIRAFLDSHEQHKHCLLMQEVDHLNRVLGRDSVIFAAQEITRDWQAQPRYLSRRFTTQWTDLLRVT